MTLKIPYEGVVVSRQVPDCIWHRTLLVCYKHWSRREGQTVRFGTCVDDTGACVGEFGQLYAVLLAQQALVMPAFSNIVDLNCLVAF